MFIHNKYYQTYLSIITNAKNKNISRKTTNLERHHIIPKSLGGKNLANNLIYLTYREHFVCHRLLCKCTKGEAYNKMCFALWRMVNYPHSKFKVSSHAYNQAKENISKLRKNLKNPMQGRNHTEESKKKMSETRKGKRLGEENTFYGKKHSQETKEKVRDKKSPGLFYTPYGIFKSANQASKTIGISRNTVFNRCKSDAFSDYIFIPK